MRGQNVCWDEIGRSRRSGGVGVRRGIQGHGRVDGGWSQVARTSRWRCSGWSAVTLEPTGVCNVLQVQLVRLEWRLLGAGEAYDQCMDHGWDPEQQEQCERDEQLRGASSAEEHGGGRRKHSEEGKAARTKE